MKAIKTRLWNTEWVKRNDQQTFRRIESNKNLICECECECACACGCVHVGVDVCVCVDVCMWVRVDVCVCVMRRRNERKRLCEEEVEVCRWILFMAVRANWSWVVLSFVSHILMKLFLNFIVLRGFRNDSYLTMNERKLALVVIFCGSRMISIFSNSICVLLNFCEQPRNMEKVDSLQTQPLLDQTCYWERYKLSQTKMWYSLLVKLTLIVTISW